MSSITLKDLNFTYSNTDGSGGLRNVSLHIQDGGVTAILGASGSGKTTLLRLIAGFIRPSHGEILIDDQVVAGSKYVAPQERNLAVVFQSYALWPHLSVEQNIELPLKSKKLNREERQQQVTEALSLTGLTELRHRAPAELSGGQQQRVALARSIALRPGLILFDEPLSNLDAALRGRLRLQLKEMQRTTGITFIYVTHDRDEAMTLADQLVVLEKGRLLCSGAPRELYEFPPNRSAAEILSHWSGELPAIVEDASAGSMRIAGTNTVVQIKQHWLSSETTSGEPVSIFVRTQGLTIADNVGNQGPQVSGVVEHTEFTDGAVKLWVRLANDIRVSLVDSRLRPAEADEEVVLNISEQHLVVLPANGRTVNQCSSLVSA
ncbi:ABC transporter ATP-binding protein [Enteractinococcus helveticum]|uniref:ABC transporter domain-containing protein n=1 Tax=Enteractinococcus helveticum TaxID=1837282 RepID=A0A1B7M1G6_9MICC|nr:ABC transporter ATP-binding protein [Enteractinococcus helveticum]OAV62442.1 hypothetical protein A6F49_06970 [Enteractinococcus helveticum]